ncbi:PrpF domain-containing protein [Paludibacterium sp.]|uniref:PrpF domain-containing protein n=1 Tax=Paludibacterium sp. TaxID=1917523 RepID=UPI0025D684C9|nr:PrpF domain-containing protein [Paludibacterium sp.]
MRLIPPMPLSGPYRAGGVWHCPVHLVRGGTSTGLVLPQSLMPADAAVRDELLRHLLGVPLQGDLPNNRQLTGLGRVTPTSNKVFLVNVEHAESGWRLVSTLAQLAAHTDAIDWRANCGNLTSSLPLWALDVGLLQPEDDGSCRMVIRNTNTGVISEARLQCRPDGQPRCDGMPGVDGAWPAVDLTLLAPAGAKTGRLLPTGAARDEIDGIPVSCVDVAVPMVLIRAADLGKSAEEAPAALAQDTDFMRRLRQLWVAAALRMGLTDADGRLLDEAALARSETLPKVAILAPGRGESQLLVRYFTPQQPHAALAVSGACCIASACLVPGTVANELATGLPALRSAQVIDIVLENPAGLLRARIEAEVGSRGVDILRAVYRRNAQILMRGHVPLTRASSALAGWLARVAAQCQA